MSGVLPRCLGLDLETTGVDVFNDRIVTACAVLVEDGRAVHTREWLVAVDIDIPEGATAVHGITTTHAREHGMPADVAVKEIANAVRWALTHSVPLILFNGAFDLSMLNAECARHGLGSPEDVCGQPIAPVLDGYVLDKAADRYRPGSRKLADVAGYYGVTLDNAHNATADAVAAVGVIQALSERSRMPRDAVAAMYGDRKYPDSVARSFGQLAVPLMELHTRQVGWYRERQEGLGTYWAGEREKLLAQAVLDDPPAVEGLPDASPDERREALRQQADELAARVASLRFSWPIEVLS